MRRQKKKESSKPNKGGRPPVAIEPKQVHAMASYGCTVAEIAAVMECSADTIERRFGKELRTRRNARNGMLRVKQFKLAEKSAAMAIFLGKNYLGQTDRFKLEWLTDDELLAVAREAGISIGTRAESPSAGGTVEPKPD
jgi:hypothetical protein